MARGALCAVSEPTCLTFSTLPRLALLAQLEQQLREASSRAETEAAQRAQLERQLADTQQQLRAAQAKAAEAEALPGLRQELAAANAEAARLAERERQLEQEGEDLRSQLAEAHAAAEAAAAQAAEVQRSTDELAAAHAVVQQQLRGEVAELQVGEGWRPPSGGWHELGTFPGIVLLAPAVPGRLFSVSCFGQADKPVVRCSPSSGPTT